PTAAWWWWPRRWATGGRTARSRPRWPAGRCRREHRSRPASAGRAGGCRASSLLVLLDQVGGEDGRRAEIGQLLVLVELDGHGRELEHEARTDAAGAVLHPRPAAVQVDVLLHQGESEAHAFTAAAPSGG